MIDAPIPPNTIYHQEGCMHTKLCFDHTAPESIWPDPGQADQDDDAAARLTEIRADSNRLDR